MWDCRIGQQWRKESANDPDLENNEKAHGVEDAKNDYAVLDGEKSVGRIYKEVHGDPRWCWSINTSPYSAPPPHNGVAKTLEDARYEEMKRMGVRPFG
jgi:hypothetical protein